MTAKNWLSGSYAKAFTSTGELNLLDELPTRTKYLPAADTLD